jgi:hypothetical protein
MLRRSCLFTLALLLPLSVNAKDKDQHKPLLPTDVLRAETVFVTIHPDAGEPLANLSANSKAREAVEKALDKWGRFRLVQDFITADLIFTVRTGTSQMVRPTVKGSPSDNRPVIVQPADNGNIRIGAQHGRPPDLNQPMPGQDTGPRMSTEVGASEDTLEVYRGREEQPPWDTSPVWRYSAKNALRAPTVLAVEQFQNAITEAEKAASQKPTQQKP